MKDSLWSIDLFRCESILLKTHWVLVVLDQFTRRIIGFGVHVGDVDGVACAACSTVQSQLWAPQGISALTTIHFSSITGGGPISEFLRLMRSIPFPIHRSLILLIERLIGTIRREYLDHTLFWNATDLERKLSDFQSYYNLHRTHSSLGGDTPA
ncbi:MAG: transposase, partial [Planctomycetes bacterium]|nr:transposase [Planctomycetota bacterium]